MKHSKSQNLALFVLRMLEAAMCMAAFYYKFAFNQAPNVKRTKNFFPAFMRVLILYMIFLTAGINSVIAQNRLYNEGLTDITRRPLVFVDSFRTDMNYFFVDPKKIESITVYKDSSALSKFGDSGKYGVVTIHPKANTTFLQIEAILNKYNISNHDRGLKICINKIVVKEPRLILIEESEILRVEITTERHRAIFEDSNSGEKFINIITQTRERNGF